MHKRRNVTARLIKDVILGPHPKRTFPLSQIHQLVVWLRRGAASMSSISRV
jgi:hypothetical protein